jgi:hypothetical protein
MIRAGKRVLILLVAAVLRLDAVCFASDFQAKNNDEIEVLATVLRSEVSLNHWTSKDMICLSIRGDDPSKKLVTALQRRRLHVCGQAEWRRKLACGYAVFFSEPVSFDPSGVARVRLESVDFRQVNKGVEHFAGLLRQGEYALREIDKRWSIVAYAPTSATTK